jgi:hypothetical protein
MVAQIIENGIMDVPLDERVRTAKDMEKCAKTEMYK